MRTSVLAFTFLLLTESAFAQNGRNLDIERFRPTPDRDGFLGIPGTRTPGEWMWNVGLWLGYELEPLTLRRVDTGDRLAVVGHRVGADFVAQLGVFDRVGVVLDVPMIVYQDADHRPLDDGPQIAAVALRDPLLAVRVRVLGEGANGENADHEGEGLALQGAVTMPFGLESSFAGEGSPQLELTVLGDFHFAHFGIGASLGYRHRFAEPELLGSQFANEIFFGAAIQSPLFFVENVSAIFEVRTDAAIETLADGEVRAFAGPTTAVEGDLGVRWAEGDLMMTWLVGAAFTGGVGAPALRAMYGLVWAPRVHDFDRDGLTDSEERGECMRLPEDPDGFQDEDGCPDPDNDGDLVPDEDDRCASEPAEFGRDANEDGCNDPVRDADRDSIADDADSCVREPEDFDQHEDEDGCPDPDNDGDSVPDANDRCQGEAEDVDQHEDGDGCPDPDNDGDGLSDADDRCAAAAEDRDEVEDTDGCPDPDNDRDGVIDGEDRCADRDEVINGVTDGDGCPDSGGRSSWRAESELGGLRGTIRFAEDGTIASISNASVDQLARHLIARWGSRWRILLPAGPEARESALREALTTRAVPATSFEIGTSTSLRGMNVEVSSVAPAP